MSSRAVIRVDSQTRGAEAGLRRVQQQYTGITREAHRAARSASRVPVAAARPGMSRQQTLTGAGSALGGRAGGAISRIGGGLAALGPVGVAAAAASVALRGLMAASDRAAESARRVHQIQTTYADALRDARRAANDQAAATLEQRRAALRELAARTGAAGPEAVARLTAAGMRDVEAGLQAIVRATGGLDANAIAAATAAARTGLIEFGDAARQAAGRRLSGDAAADAARIVQGATGRQMSPQDIAAMTTRLAATQVGRVTEMTDRMRGQGIAIQLNRALTGGAHESAARALHETTDPVMRAAERQEQAAQRVLENMNAAAEASFTIAEVFKDVGMIFGGQGSNARQAARYATDMRTAGVGN